MISYEKAKEIALNTVDGVNFKINCARGTENEYMFDNKDEFYTSHVPFIVTKADGTVHNFDNYTRQNDIAWEDWKTIDFETGLPCDEWEGRDDDKS